MRRMDRRRHRAGPSDVADDPLASRPSGFEPLTTAAVQGHRTEPDPGSVSWGPWTGGDVDTGTVTAGAFLIAILILVGPNADPGARDARTITLAGIGTRLRIRVVGSCR